MDNPIKKTIHQELLDRSSAGDAAGVARLLALGAKPTSKRRSPDLSALVLAAKNGHAECVKLLIPVSDPKAHGSLALSHAASNGHLECVKLLIPVSSPKANDSRALHIASMDGHAECVKILIPVSDPMADDSRALRSAASGGHAECIMFLIPVSNTKAEDSHALRWATYHGKADAVQALIPLSDPNAGGWDRPLLWAIRNHRVDCARLLAPITSIDHHVVSAVLCCGNAEMLSLMLENDPLFLSSSDLPSILGDAVDRGHSTLAAVLTSIIEREAIAENLVQNTSSQPPSLGRRRL